MQNHAANSHYSSNAKFSKLDWPPTEFVRAAHRARGKLLREFASAVGHWLGMAFVGSPAPSDRTSAARSGGTPGTD